MFVPLWQLAVFGVVVAVLAILVIGALRRRSGGEMIDRQQREARRIATKSSPAVALHPDDEAVLVIPEIRLALAGGQKIEAIKLVREHTGLGLREAKELVERLQAR